MASSVERVGPQDARTRVGEALLVCAYGSEEEYRRNHLEGSISLREFEARAGSLPRSQEIIFYCDCPHDEAALAQAEKYAGQGFRNVAVVSGGVAAWNGSGRYGTAPDQPG